MKISPTSPIRNVPKGRSIDEELSPAEDALEKEFMDIEDDLSREAAEEVIKAMEEEYNRLLRQLEPHLKVAFNQHMKEAKKKLLKSWKKEAKKVCKKAAEQNCYFAAHPENLEISRGPLAPLKFSDTVYIPGENE